MTIARAAAIASLIVAILAVGVLMFGSGGGTEYTVRLQSANQLVKGNEVKVGGLPIGEVTDIKLSEDNQADIKVTINDEDFAPLHEGTEATVRVTSLPSVANRYISLRPGPNNAPEIKEGGALETDETTNAVDLDQLFNTLDPKTRKGLQKTLQGFATWYAGQSDNLQKTFKYLGPSLGNFTRVMQELGRDQKTFTTWSCRARAPRARSHRGATTSPTLVVERQHVRAGDHRGERVLRPRARGLPAGAPGGQHDVRQPARRAGRAEQADERLQAAGEEPGAVPAATSPGCSRRCARRSRTCACSSTTRGRTTTPPTCCGRIPSLEQLSRKSTKNSVAALKAGQNEIEFLRPYAPDISAWLTHFAQVPAYYDANGHYARVLPIFNGFAYRPERQPAQLAQSRPSAPARNCAAASASVPGAATQPAPDGSNPFTDDGKLTADDCDPSQRGRRGTREARRDCASGCIALGVLGVLIAVVVGVGAGGDGGGDYKVRAIFDNAAFAIPGEDVMIAGAKVGVVDELEVTDDKRAAVVLKIDDAGFQDFRQRRRVPDPAPVGDRREARRVRPDAAAPGRRCRRRRPLKKIPDGQDGRRPVPAARVEHHHARRRGPDPQRDAPPVP